MGYGAYKTQQTMPLPTLSFVLGLLVLFYLSTFVLFAFLRVLTGVSIQRVGYSGLRRIAFTPRDGISIRIRGLGLSLHRPIFAQPTWITLTVTEPQIVVDLQALHASKDKTQGDAARTNGLVDKQGVPRSNGDEKASEGQTGQEKGQTWKKLTELKEKIKGLHRQVQWLRLVDLVVLRASVVIKDVGTVRVERYTLSVGYEDNDCG